MMPGRQNDEVELKVGYMVKRSQGKSTLGATNFKKRVFSLTPSRFSYYDGTVEVSVGSHFNTSMYCVSIVYTMSTHTQSCSSSHIPYLHARTG